MPTGNCSSYLNDKGKASSDSLHCPEAISEAQTVDPSPDKPVMGQGIQVANSNQLPNVSEIADSQQTAERSQFINLVQLPVDYNQTLYPGYQTLFSFVIAVAVGDCDIQETKMVDDVEFVDVLRWFQVS